MFWLTLIYEKLLLRQNFISYIIYQRCYEALIIYFKIILFEYKIMKNQLSLLCFSFPVFVLKNGNKIVEFIVKSS